MNTSLDQTLFYNPTDIRFCPQKPVFFLHIPKTAGSTLRDILHRSFSLRNTFETDPKLDDFGLAGLKASSPAKKAAIHLITGHMPFGVHELFQEHCGYFTFLREPRDRSISDYYFVKSQPETHYLYQQANSLSLEAYLEYRASINRDNVHTRMISGIWDNAPFDPNNEAMLELAINNLKSHFFMIGITSQFDESLLILKQKLQLRSVYYKPKNITAKRAKLDSISNSALDALTYHNRLDIELFRVGHMLFKNQISLYQGSLDDDLVHLTKTNQRYGRIIQQYWQIHGAIDRRVSRAGSNWLARNPKY